MKTAKYPYQIKRTIKTLDYSKPESFQTLTACIYESLDSFDKETRKFLDVLFDEFYLLDSDYLLDTDLLNGYLEAYLAYRPGSIVSEVVLERFSKQVLEMGNPGQFWKASQGWSRLVLPYVCQPGRVMHFEDIMLEYLVVRK